MYQILCQSVRFCRLYVKNILVCFFGSQCNCRIMSTDSGICEVGLQMVNTMFLRIVHIRLIVSRLFVGV